MWIGDLEFYMIIGILVLLLVLALMFLIAIPVRYVGIFLRCAFSPSRHALVILKPFNELVLGKLHEGGILFEFNGVKYFTIAKKFNYFLGKYKMYEFDIDEGYAMDYETKRELDKLVKAAGIETAQDYIAMLLKYRKLSKKENKTKEDLEKLNKIDNYLKSIENTYNVNLRKVKFINSNGEESENLDDIEPMWVVSKINFDKIRDFYMTVNPATAYYYAENLAYSLLKFLKFDYIKVGFGALLVLIGVGVLYILISGNQPQIDYNQLAHAIASAQQAAQNTAVR